MRLSGKKRAIELSILPVFFIFLLQSCSVIKIKNKLSTNTAKEYAKSCDINYSVSISSGYSTNTFGRQNDKNYKTIKLKNKYIDSTKQVFARKGCTATYSIDGRNADFKISIIRQVQLSALPQEWLCGLSCGIIPAWATRKGELIYTFEKIGLNNAYTYDIDRTNYCHILLLPFGFKSMFADELNTYAEALTNYIESDSKILLKTNPE